jgi:hypothetical protein
MDFVFATHTLGMDFHTFVAMCGGSWKMPTYILFEQLA